jgi:hypothetical protein
MKSLLIPLLAIASALTANANLTGTFTLGGNFNESLEDAKVPYLDAAGAQWIRGFLPATEFVGGPRKLASDPLLQTFHEAAKSGRHIALTLKWDFKDTETRVPAPDSPREKAYFAWALDVIKFGKPDLLLLVNEVFVDTMEEDMVPNSEGAIPMVRFLKRLTTHIHEAKPTTSDGRNPLPLSCGGFTRMETKAKRTAPATMVMLPWLSQSKELSFVNFHMHGDDLDDFYEALKFMRLKVPMKPFIITEFSLVWRYKKNLQDTLGSSNNGKLFAKKYQLDPATTTLDFLNACIRQQVPEKQFNEFLHSRTWYVPTFLDQAIDLMKKHGVRHAFYAFHQGPPSKRLMKADTTPWSLNPIFIDRFALSPDPKRPAANLDFFKSFLRQTSAAK